VVERELASASGKVRRKLIWLANYHNRFIGELRSRYDENDTDGEFEAEIGLHPRQMFDGLLIQGHGTDFATAVSRLIGQRGDGDELR
jgi:hypothetical protein